LQCLVTALVAHNSMLYSLTELQCQDSALVGHSNTVFAQEQ
jgi:hypothetical protein